MKNTNKTNRIARTLTAAMAAVMMMTAAASVTASADTSAVASMSVSTAASKSGGYFYHGKKVIEGHYKVDGNGNYSFGYFHYCYPKLSIIDLCFFSFVLQNVF